MSIIHMKILINISIPYQTIIIAPYKTMAKIGANTLKIK